MNKVKMLMLGIGAGFVVIVLFTIFVPYRITTVLSESMVPTIAVDEKVVIYVGELEIESQDIIAFYRDIEDMRVFLTKRVVAIPGDSVVSDGISLFVNNNVICDSQQVFSVVVPAGSYFVVGDNYTNSYDSREWPGMFVERSDIVGSVERKLDMLRIIE